MKTVSIIIPTYNARDYVREAVRSALAQTYQNVEIIVVDDGSTDDTKKILEPYARDGKINYIYQANQGLAGARNTGVKAARGEYIAFLDSDDLFLPKKVERQVAALESHPDFGVCYSDVNHFTEMPNGRRFYHHRYTYPSGNIFEPLLHRQFINPLCVMVRREVIKKYGMFDENLRRSEDWELWLRWAHSGVKFYHVDEALAQYRVRIVGNLSSMQSEPEMKKKNLEFFEALGRKLNPEEWRKYNFKKILDRLRIKLALAHLMVGKKNEARAELRNFPFWKFIAAIIPAGIWKFALGRGREIKHRFLLEKI